MKKPPKENSWEEEEISLTGLILLRNKIRQETLQEIIEMIPKEIKDDPEVYIKQNNMDWKNGYNQAIQELKTKLTNIKTKV